MAVVFWGIANVALFGIGLMRRTGQVAVFTAVALAINVGLNFLLIPPFGIVGASIANLIAYVVLAGPTTASRSSCTPRRTRWPDPPRC